MTDGQNLVRFPNPPASSTRAVEPGASLSYRSPPTGAKKTPRPANACQPNDSDDETGGPRFQSEADSRAKMAAPPACMAPTTWGLRLTRHPLAPTLPTTTRARYLSPSSRLPPPPFSPCSLLSSHIHTEVSVTGGGSPARQAPSVIAMFPITLGPGVKAAWKTSAFTVAQG